jgi:hypothetical protein
LKLILIAVAALSLSTGCKKAGIEEASRTPADTAQTGAAPVEPLAGASAAKVGTVTETMDAAGYTYVQVDAGTETFWAAAPEFEVVVGDEVSVPPGMPMANYHSETLDRDFDVVFFVPSIAKAGEPIAADDPSLMQAPHPAPSASVDVADIDLAGLVKAEGGQTVAEIFGQKESLSGKEVRIRGKVVKFSGGIMGKNWLHLQDGTDHEGSNDLTVTTQAVVAKGDTVVVSGVLVTDKDFGAGYRYDVILEDAEVKTE